MNAKPGIFLLAFLIFLTGMTKVQEKPNIILICADDLGWSDIGCYGSEVQTPNLDKLADEGIRFRHFHNTSKCFPSRSCLLTGVCAQQNGYAKDFKQPLTNSVTLGEVLKTAGYRTLWSGKHHGLENPVTRGFDRYYGLKDGACTYFNPGNQRPGDGAAYPRDLYAAFISTLDDKIGLLLKKVSDLGLTEKTIIIFQSDNGYSTEERAHFGGGSAGIYRGAKACLFEGGIRVPAIISWPGKIQKGEVRDQFAVNTDRFPTLAELCGIQQNTDNLNAKSLVPVIQNANAETAHADGYCWAFKNMWVARKGKWKLLGNPQDTSQPDAVFTEKLFLVNLEDDPGETTNLAEKFPEKMKELESPYRQWLANSNQNLIS